MSHRGEGLGRQGAQEGEWLFLLPRDPNNKRWQGPVLRLDAALPYRKGQDHAQKSRLRGQEFSQGLGLLICRMKTSEASPNPLQGHSPDSPDFKALWRDWGRGEPLCAAGLADAMRSSLTAH